MHNWAGDAADRPADGRLLPLADRAL